MDAHFGDTFTHRLTVAEIAVLDSPDTMDDSGAPHFVFQAREPSVEFLRAFKAAHVLRCIRLNTATQYLLNVMRVLTVGERPNVRTSGHREVQSG